ncbi:hypothetical protein ACFY97_18505 [Streptomyces klenkii]|uniref:hypothetical protein n=1 Tax=Streptomyces klenkii TaxID=1420899 RepID=UPI0036F0BD3E
MPFMTHSCVAVRCDGCGNDLDDEYVVHCATEDEARGLARSAAGWRVFSTGEVLCPERDADHQVVIDRLMPPEPQIPITGQLTIDGEEEK